MSPERPWATVIAQAVSFLLSQIYLARRFELFRFDLKKITFDRTIFLTTLKIGLPTGIQQMLVATGMMALSRIVNNFRDHRRRRLYRRGKDRLLRLHAGDEPLRRPFRFCRPKLGRR